MCLPFKLFTFKKEIVSEVKPTSQTPKSNSDPLPILDELGNYEDIMAPEFVYGIAKNQISPSSDLARK